MILDDMNKSRQMMLKNSGPSRLAAARGDPNICTDQRSLGMITALETSNHPVTWIPNNSNYNNPILPAFPRFEDDPPKKEDNQSSNPGPSTT